MKRIEWETVIVVVLMIVTVLSICIPILSDIGNEQNRIKEGTVIDKDFSAGYLRAWGDGIIRRQDDTYKLLIRGKKNGKIVDYWLECTQQEYESYSIGDYFKR